MRVITLKGGFDKNLCYLVAGEGSSRALLVDASVEGSRILEAARGAGLELDYVFVTHPHGDHVWALGDVLAHSAAEVLVYGRATRTIGAPAGRVRGLADGEELRWGELTLRFLFTPGHEPDHMCLHIPESGVLFTGDTLFVGRTGRTRSAQASARQLFRSIRDRIQPLPDTTRFYPGHDYGEVPSRTLGEERRLNAFLKAADEDEFVRVMAAYERSRAGG